MPVLATALVLSTPHLVNGFDQGNCRAVMVEVSELLSTPASLVPPHHTIAARRIKETQEQQRKSKRDKNQALGL